MHCRCTEVFPSDTYGRHVWLCPVNSIKNEHSYVWVTQKLAGGNAEILSSWGMETMKGEKSERTYKGEKQSNMSGSAEVQIKKKRKKK